ncbi:response regulator [Altererythrobacter soli]|uniref:Response regulator n=1 Tax=Croceibacterium soli TaxID=1739690 RepID=A0A6I4UTG6_9SPHN|nr:response regulator [Croceibacterium soli]MXP41009.1 response regulator [Croceibacterium soli]
MTGMSASARLCRPSDEFDPPPVPAAFGIHGEDAGLRERILVVEDDYFVSLTIEADLVDAGYEVVAVVATGEAALARADSLRPDLAIVDIRLAGKLDGIETATELLRRGIHCIFATAHSDLQTRERARAACPLGWLTKPFTSGDLLQAVKQGLADSGSH